MGTIDRYKPVRLNAVAPHDSVVSISRLLPNLTCIRYYAYLDLVSVYHFSRHSELRGRPKAHLQAEGRLRHDVVREVRQVIHRVIVIEDAVAHDVGIYHVLGPPGSRPSCPRRLSQVARELGWPRSSSQANFSIHTLDPGLPGGEGVGASRSFLSHYEYSIDAVELQSTTRYLTPDPAIVS